MCRPYHQVCCNRVRLKKVGLLKRGEESNADAVAAAKAKFKQTYGFAVEDRGKPLVS